MRFILFIIICLPIYFFGQETTGALLIKIENYSEKEALVILTQISTGFESKTYVDKDGYARFSNLQPANDYDIHVNSEGFEKYFEKNIQIQLGITSKIFIILQKKLNNIEEVLVKGNSIKKGNEKLLKLDVVKNLPTLNRSIQDATRLLPENNLNSFGGANYRFNNLSIDGSATNDVLGFQEPSSGATGSLASGTPGGLAGTQPIGFGAISAISVKVAPFDVTLGNFTGASINVVTKSGTNQFNADVYGFFRNKNLTGNYADGIKQPVISFLDYQLGTGIGGALIKNKIFYFFNAEFAYRTEPVQNAPGSETSSIAVETINKIYQKLKNTYNYDAGSFTSADLERKSTKLFIRFDFNLDQNNKLTLRNNFVTGFADNLEWSQNVFNFGNQGYRHNTINNILALELKTKLNQRLSNKLILSHSLVEDNRTYEGKVFPHLEIIDNTVNNIFAGTYREASIYGLTLNTIQFTDNFVYTKDKHNVTFGVSSEINNIEYRFLTAFNGRWQYRSLADFLADKPSRVRGVYNVENNDLNFNKNEPSADYSIILSSIYLQDEIRISNKLNLTAGFRIDSQFYPGEFPLSEDIKSTPEFSKYKNQINTNPQINPRVGFNFSLTDNITLKAGSGLFTGRMPFVWYAYPEYISGTKYFNIDFRPSGVLPIEENLANLESVQGKKLTEINLVDNDFSLPRDWKTNLSVDIKLKSSFNINIEGTYSKVLKSLLFQSINRKEELKSNFDGADNRPYYNFTNDAIKVNTKFTNVFLLTNVSEGYRYNLTLNLSKSSENYNGFLGYTYGLSKDISSTNRNSHAANFEWNQSIIANTPNLSYSNFDLRHKFVSYHFYEKKFGIGNFKIGFIYNGRSGSPFSFVYEGDVNRDGSAKNDLIYIPRNASEIQLQDFNSANGIVTKEVQWQQLDNYISNDAYLSEHRGEYAQRNAAKTPWNHQIDVKVIFEKKLFSKNVQFTFDIFNFGNLISKNLGAQHFVPNINNSGYALLDFIKIENNKPVYQFNQPTGNPWLIDPISSRWQAQFGINVSF